MQQESNITSSNIPQTQFPPLHISFIIHLKVRSVISKAQIITRLAFTVLARQQQAKKTDNISFNKTDTATRIEYNSLKYLQPQFCPVQFHPESGVSEAQIITHAH